MLFEGEGKGCVFQEQCRERSCWVVKREVVGSSRVFDSVLLENGELNCRFLERGLFRSIIRGRERSELVLERREGRGGVSLVKSLYQGWVVTNLISILFKRRRVAGDKETFPQSLALSRVAAGRG